MGAEAAHLCASRTGHEKRRLRKWWIGYAFVYMYGGSESRSASVDVCKRGFLGWEKGVGARSGSTAWGTIERNNGSVLKRGPTSALQWWFSIKTQQSGSRRTGTPPGSCARVTWWERAVSCRRRLQELEAQVDEKPAERLKFLEANDMVDVAPLLTFLKQRLIASSHRQQARFRGAENSPIWGLRLRGNCHTGFLATGLVVTVTRPDVGDATGPIVTVTVVSLQVRTTIYEQTYLKHDLDVKYKTFCTDSLGSISTSRTWSTISQNSLSNLIVAYGLPLSPSHVLSRSPPSLLDYFAIQERRDRPIVLLIFFSSSLPRWGGTGGTTLAQSRPRCTVPMPDRSIAVRWQQEERKSPPFVATNEQDRRYAAQCQWFKFGIFISESWRQTASWRVGKPSLIQVSQCICPELGPAARPSGLQLFGSTQSLSHPLAGRRLRIHQGNRFRPEKQEMYTQPDEDAIYRPNTLAFEGRTVSLYLSLLLLRDGGPLNSLVAWCCAKIQAETKRQTYSIERSFPERSYLTGSPPIRILASHRANRRIPRTRLRGYILFAVSIVVDLEAKRTAQLAPSDEIANTWQPPPHPVLSPKFGRKNGPLNLLLSLGRWGRRHHARRIPSDDP
ncbi:hypothetical protein DFH08DRAFT_945563 [Mycena albidolilacea]|uniref:Uncharacterized protein n=1 Tax=Mycena albidolilacea TaxID=1033008 RepID=A0AAD7E8C3_9AGAR|nr:hypothetical protein DFH08DRAFT_945563 [Mycena albidolilacea]